MLSALLLAALPAVLPAPSETSLPDADRYVYARPGATLRNLNDADGRVLMRVDERTMAAVFRERAGWYNVEIPGGFPVWVFGRFLRETEEKGVLELSLIHI